MLDALLWTLYFWIVCVLALGAGIASLVVWIILDVFRRIQRQREGRPAHRGRP